MSAEPQEFALGDLKLLSLIKQGDLEGVKNITSKWNHTDYLRLKESEVYPFHLAVCFGHLDLVKLFCSLDGFDINQKNQEGSTPLHLAASQGHLEIAQYLLSQPQIDDLCVDNEGKDALARSAFNEEIASAIIDSRHAFVGRTTEKLHELLKEKDFSGVRELFSSEKTSTARAGRLLDINQIRDPQTGRTILHEAAVLNDIESVSWLVRSLKADTTVKDFECQLPYDLATDPKVKETLTEVKVSTDGSLANPRLEGTLKKWTNLASGFKDRYFVLEDGRFSYFKSKDDVDKACRGTIIMKAAQVHWKEGSAWFEVVGVGHLKFELKANHIVEAKKWVAALLEAKSSQTHNNHNTDRSSTFTDESEPFNTIGTRSKPKMSHLLRDSIHVSTQKKRASINSFNSFRLEEGTLCSPKSHVSQTDARSFPMSSYNSEPFSPLSTPGIDSNRSVKAALMSISNYANVQSRILDLILSKGESETHVQVPIDSIKTLLESIQCQRNLIQDAIQFDTDREEYWNQLNIQQNERQALWQKNLESLAKEHHQLEGILRQQSALQKFKKVGQAVMAIRAVSAESGRISSENSTGTSSPNLVEPEVYITDDEDDFFDANDGLDTQLMDNYREPPKSSKSDAPPNTNASSVDTELDARHDITMAYEGYPSSVSDFRDKLEMSGDINPDVSIWSILKNSVGKDLSKIAVPVEFNESNSMLQRMCEDIEYSNLIDIAVQQSESLERMLWVAAFAMSNYSSTLGRTGKPFNPLLGETFEYVRPDRGYRYVSEQVSHHPPISACYCESTNYIFQSEVNLVSKFWGKSFELNPKGVTHLFLKLPQRNSDSHSDHNSVSTSEVVEEHYSWTKVTSAMNNIIIGSMYIEHYGDMVIKNHRTGEECTLTFHRTGWRSSNKHVVRGMVRDGNGREVWEIGGRWDDKLVARRVGSNDGEDLVEKGEENCAKSEPDQKAGDGARPILLWKMEPRPKPKIAYNLTKFAVTLNEMTDNLKPYLPPTDSRHRPDQRAMERGDFSAANDLKVELEAQQRKRRKDRTDSHTPRWFTKQTDPDSNSPIWTFNNEYWSERHRCGTLAAKGSETTPEWDNVEPIFSLEK